MADDFCQLVNILEQVHRNYGLVHRDVRLSNCFRHPATGMVFLNDWGCATKARKKVKFSGALQFAPEHVIQCWHLNETYEPTFADDLEMVVKSVFQTLFFITFEEIRAEKEAEKIIKFWHYHLTPTIWSSMLAAAQKEEYESLKAQIRDLLPGTHHSPQRCMFYFLSNRPTNHFPPSSREYKCWLNQWLCRNNSLPP
ncbi:hypothetical protein QOT17_017169 [Balamuthia mandrillaris]